MADEQRWHIGVVLEALLDRPLDEVMGWVRAAAPEVTHIKSESEATLPTRTATSRRCCHHPMFVKSGLSRSNGRGCPSRRSTYGEIHSNPNANLQGATTRIFAMQFSSRPSSESTGWWRWQDVRLQCQAMPRPTSLPAAAFS